MSEFFYKGDENTLDDQKEVNKDVNPNKRITDAFLKVLDNKNLSFLLGSGCSSYLIDNENPIVDVATSSEETSSTSVQKNKQKEIGIPVMAPMAQEFYNSSDFTNQKDWLKNQLKINVDDKVFKFNLEKFLSTLHSLSFYHSTIASQIEGNEKGSTEKKNEEKSHAETFESLDERDKINSIIKLVRDFILKKCLNESNTKPSADREANDTPLIEVYKQFYRKLLTRNSTLPRLNIFTTNYDLYSEKAMDLLGIHYVNGFTGGISKYFNPAIFNYALAEKMDLSQSKWSVIDNFFYLYKIHGSVNWIEAEGENKLFKVKEIQEPNFCQLKDEQTIMIHPTPLKYNASLGSPYSDLFREFQKKLMQNNNILVTIGYSFSDEHINNIIFQAFTIPSFRLIVIGEPTENNAIGNLRKLKDSRIWIIGEKVEAENGSTPPLHFFKRFVAEILPDLTAEDLDKKMEETIKSLKNIMA